MKFLSDILAKAGLVVDGVTQLNTVANATTDTDKFLVSDGGVVKYRTGAQIAGDIGPGNLSVSTVKHLVKLGEAAAKGQAVYVSSADGTNMIVSKASNATEGTSSKTLGLLETGGVLNDQVYVITEGLLAGLDTSTAVAGDPVWLGTGGNLIFGLLNKPYAPAHLVFIGIVTRVQQNNGEIFVKVQNGFELKEIHDVQITTTPADNTVLSYETSSSLYKMKSIPTLLGYTPVPTTRTLTINGTAYDLSADRSWSITAGVSSVSAGTGISVNSTTGAVIVTNTGLLSATAGSGISVSTSGGTLTVSNTGLLSALAGSGISVSTSGGTLSISNTGILSGVAGSGISVSTSGGTLTISNTGLLSALAGSGISVNTSGGTVTVSNTGVLSVVAGSGISVSTSGGTVTVTNTITNNNQLTNGAGYITGYTETDTLATVTGRGATTSTVVTFSGGDGNNSSVKLAGYNQRGGAGYHGFLEATNTFGSATNSNKYFRIDSAGTLQIVNSAYTAIIFNLTNAGDFSVPGSVTAGSFIKSGGTSSQFLKADGSVDSSTYATQSYVGTQIANLVASAPSTLDTLNELAAALGNDANFSTTVTNSIATKVPQTRTLTINGTAYDLSADRSWTIVAGVSSVNAGTGVSVNSTTGAVTVSIGQSVATTAQVTFDSVLTTNNGNGTNYKVGDDAWIGDINLANTIRIQGVQDATQGYIVFGNSNGTALGRSGTGALTYGGNTVYHAGNLTNLNQLTNGPGYITGNQTITLSGDATGSGTTAITVTLANSGVTAGTYTKVTVDAKGRVTSGTTLSAGDIPTLSYVAKSGDSMTGNLSFGSSGAGLTWAANTDGASITFESTGDGASGGRALSNLLIALTDNGDEGLKVTTTGTELLYVNTNQFQYKGNTIWHSGNDGSGSGLDADLLDGISSASFLRSDVVDATVTGTILSTNNANVDGANFEVDTTNKTVNEYAYKVSRSGSAVGGILIDGRGVFASGTTVNGSTVWHQGNLTNLNQLTNGPGYLTAESDTLATVVSRGNATSNSIRVKRPSNKVDNNGNPIEFGGRVEFNNDFVSGQSGYMAFRYPTYNNFLIGGDYDGNIGGGIPNIQFGRANGSVYMHIAAGDGSGNIGINTTSPSAKLHVEGTFINNGTTGDVAYISSTFATAATNGRVLHIRDNKAAAGTDSYVSVGWTSSPGQDVYIGKRTTSSAGFLAIQNSSATELFTINLSSGNAGIQVSNPTNKFQIGSVGSTGYGGNDLVIGNGTQVMAFYQSSSVSTWYTNTNFSLMPSGTGSTGNLGVGVTSPSYRVDIGGSLRLTGALVLDDTTSNVIQHRAGTDVNTLVTVGHGGFDHNGYLRIGGANVATQTWVQSQGYITPNSTVSGWIAFQASTQGTTIIRAVQQDTTSGYYLFQGVTGSTEMFRVDRSGAGYFANTITTDGNIYISNNGGRLYFDRPNGATVGSVGWHTNDVFYVAGHPDYGPTAGNSVRVYGFGADLHLGNSNAGDVITIANNGTITTNYNITSNGSIVMGTSGTQYIRMGRFPSGVGNSGEAWIGRASDRSAGTMTVQLGGSSNGSYFEVVDHAWSMVVFSAGMNTFNYKNNTIWHAGNLTNLNQLTNGPGYITSTNSDFTYAASLTLSTSWQDTGVSATNLSTSGVYLLTCALNDFGVSGGQYTETYAGIMYWYAGSTNSTNYSEIQLHHSGHADNDRYIYLRTRTDVGSSTAKIYLQIKGNGNNSGASTYTFTFKRLL